LADLNAMVYVSVAHKKITWSTRFTFVTRLIIDCAIRWSPCCETRWIIFYNGPRDDSGRKSDSTQKDREKEQARAETRILNR